MRRTLTALTALAASLALTACEPEEDKNNDVRPRADMSAPDMTPDQDAPDQGPDQDAPDQSAAGLLLVGVTAEGPRVHEASAPEKIKLALAVEGDGEAPAEVAITFTTADGAQTLTAPYAAELEVQPPALPTHRGAVEVAVTLGEATVKLDGGLSYGATPVFASGALVSQLTGIERADEVFTLADEVIVVRQRPTQGPAPTPGFLLEEAADTFAAFKLTDGRATALGAPIKIDGVGLVAQVEQPDGTPLLLLTRRGAAGETLITALRVDASGAKDDKAVPLATLLDTQDVQSVSMRGGVLFVLTERVNAAGERVVEVVNTATGARHGSPLLNKLGPGRRLVSQIKGSAEPDPSLTVIGWVQSTDGYDMTVVDDVTSELPISGVIATTDVAPDERPIDIAMVADSGKRYLAYAYATSAGTRMELGELVRARTVMTVVTSITTTLPGVHLDMFGGAEVEPPTARAVPPRLRMVRADYCGDGSSFTAPGTGRCGPTDHLRAASSGAWMLTLPLNGDKAQVEAMSLQSGLNVARERGFRASISIRVVKSAGAGGRRQIVEVAGNKLASWSYEATREEAVVEGRLVAGARRLVAGAVVPVGADRLHVGVVEAGPTASDASEGGLTLSAGRFGVVLAINNTKKEPAVPDVANLMEGEVLSYSGAVAPVYAQASHGLLFGVEGTRVRGTRRSGLLRMTGAALAALKDGEAPRVGVNAGLVFLPEGFVVDRLVAHEDEVYFLGVKGGAASRFKDGRYEGGLFRVTAPANGKGEVGAPEELMSAAKLRAESGDADAELTSLMLGDADPTTPLPGLIALTTGGPRIITKEIDKSTPALLRKAEGGAVTILDAVLFDEQGAYLLGFEGGELGKPARLTFTATGLNRNAAPITRVAGVELGGDYKLDQRDAAVIVLDLNGDGRSDALVTAPGPGTQGRGYQYLYLGTPGGGFTPILTPDAVIYGALRLTTGLASGVVALGDALASKLRR
jgi:hypothetical protein